MLSQLMSKDEQEVSEANKERCATVFIIKQISNLYVYWKMIFSLQAADAENKIDNFLKIQDKEEADRVFRAQVLKIRVEICRNRHDR